MIGKALTSLVDVKRLMRVQTRWETLTADAKQREAELLEALIAEVSEYFIGFLGRDPRNLKHVEYVGGARIVPLDNYPIISIESALYDSSRRWSSPETLELGEDFEIWDADSGILRFAFEPKPNTVKLTYRAGYEYALIGIRATLAFSEDGGTTTLTASLQSGLYDAWSLAAMVESALNEAGSLNYTVGFDDAAQAFTISADGSFTVQPSQTPSTWELLGFEEDETGTSLSSQFPMPTVPFDLQRAATEMVIWRYKYFEKDRVAVTFEASGDQTIRYDFTDIPFWIRRVLMRYRRKLLG